MKVLALFCLLVASCLAAVPPVVDQFTVPPAAGGDITITGSSFDQAGFEPFVTLDASGQEDLCVPILYSDTVIVCTAPAGVGKHLTSYVFLNDLGTSESPEELRGYFDFRYEAPVINSIDLPTDIMIDERITVNGKNFGTPGAFIFATVSGVPMSGYEHVSDGQLIVGLPTGVGNNNEIVVYTGPLVWEVISVEKRGYSSFSYSSFWNKNLTMHQSGTAATKVAYTSPVPELETCDNEPVSSVAFSEGMVITICGTNFEPSFAVKKDEIDLGWNGVVAVTVGGQECALECSSFGRIKCVAPTGLTGSAAVVVSIHGYNLTLPYTVAYTSVTTMGPLPPPVVTSIVPTTLNTNKRAVGGKTVTIHGLHFGGNTAFYNSRRTIRVGQFACTNVKYVSEGVLSCVLPANVNGQNLAVHVTINHQSNEVLVAPVLDTTGADQSVSCGFPNGALDTNNFDMCNCFSGFAPANANGDCDVAARCPGRIIEKTHVGGSAPSRPHTTFRDDRLTIVQTSPIVHGRRDYHLRLVSPTHNASVETCNYPGPIWTKTVSSLDCLDVYTMVLPWTQNAMCGFGEVAGDVAYNTYSSTLVATYREIVMTNNVPSVRASTVSHVVTVKFQRELTIALESTSIIPTNYEDSEIDIIITEDALYDPATMETLIVFDTIISAPFQLAALNGTWIPASNDQVPEGGNVTVTVVLQTPQPGDLQCSNFKDSCSQRWTMRLKTISDEGVAVCNLKGNVDFVPSLLCRDSEASPSACPSSVTPPLDATIEFSTATDLCEDSSDDVDASGGLDFVVSTFEDSGFAEPQSTFQTADVAYFQVAIVDTTGTIDGITFNRITIRNEDGTPSPLYNIDENVAVPTSAHFNITSELIKSRDEPLAPGTIFLLAFRVTLTRELDALGTLSAETESALSVEIVADIAYHGNDKRTVVVQNNLQKTAIAKIVIVGGGFEEADEVALDDEEEFSLSFDNAAYSTTFSMLALAVVAALALVM